MSYYCFYNSPMGELLLAGEENNLRLIKFANSKSSHPPVADWQHAPQIFNEVVTQLSEYFAGKRQNFSVRYTLSGTAFQQNVLQSVANIAYGQTASYSEIALQINNPKAVRAVGMANATNRLPIIIPCHRVIGKNGVLTGFAGGLDIKQKLLNLESRAILSHNDLHQNK